jgi:hypothetical protein
MALLGSAHMASRQRGIQAISASSVRTLDDIAAYANFQSRMIFTSYVLRTEILDQIPIHYPISAVVILASKPRQSPTINKETI